jgi:hypothetical protein
VIVLVIKMAKAFGNRFQSRSFGLLIERVVGVGSIGDLAEEDKRAVVGQFVFFSGSLRTNIPYRDGRARRSSRHKESRRAAWLLPLPCPAA